MKIFHEHVTLMEIIGTCEDGIPRQTHSSRHILDLRLFLNSDEVTTTATPLAFSNQHPNFVITKSSDDRMTIGTLKSNKKCNQIE